MFKVLTAEGKGVHPATCHVCHSLPVRNEDGTVTPGPWLEKPGPLGRGPNGLHITMFPRRHRNATDSRVFAVEYEGEVLVRGQGVVVWETDDWKRSPAETYDPLIVGRYRLVRELTWDDPSINEWEADTRTSWLTLAEQQGKGRAAL